MASVSDILREGIQHFRAGRDRDAARLFREVLAVEPANTIALAMLQSVATASPDPSPAGVVPGDTGTFKTDGAREITAPSFPQPPPPEEPGTRVDVTVDVAVAVEEDLEVDLGEPPAVEAQEPLEVDLEVDLEVSPRPPEAVTVVTPMAAADFDSELALGFMAQDSATSVAGPPPPPLEASAGSVPASDAALALGHLTGHFKALAPATLLLLEAQQHLRVGDLWRSVECASRALVQDPTLEHARVFLEENQEAFLVVCEERLGGFSAVPRLKMTMDRVLELKMTPRAGYVMSRVDGMMSCEDIITLTAMPRLEVAFILANLHAAGVVGR